MLWICWAFDSRQNSWGNSSAFLPGFTGIECGVLTGYLPGYEVLRDGRFQYGGKTTNLSVLFWLFT